MMGIFAYLLLEKSKCYRNPLCRIKAELEYVLYRIKKVFRKQKMPKAIVIPLPISPPIMLTEDMFKSEKR